MKILTIFILFSLTSVSVLAQTNTREELVSRFDSAKQRYEEVLGQKDSLELEKAYKEWFIATDELDRFDRKQSSGFWTPSPETLDFHNRFKTSVNKIGEIDLFFKISKPDYQIFYTKQKEIFTSSSANKSSEIKDIDIVIFGTVRDMESRPVDSVEVVINNLTTWTDGNGNYTLKLPSVGLFDVGYQYDFSLTRVRKFPNLYINQAQLDFGTTDVDASQTMTLSIANTGHRDLMITSIEFENDVYGEFDSNWQDDSSMVLGIGQTRDIEIYFDASIEGEKEVLLRFSSNDPDTLVKTVSVSAKVEKSLLKFLQRKVEKGEYGALVDLFNKVIRRKGINLGS